MKSEIKIWIGTIIIVQLLSVGIHILAYVIASLGADHVPPISRVLETYQGVSLVMLALTIIVLVIRAVLRLFK